MTVVVCFFITRQLSVTINRLDVTVGQVIRIDVLPDNVLLGAFDFYMDLSPESIEVW